jgi:hypothetical protein
MMDREDLIHHVLQTMAAKRSKPQTRCEDKPQARPYKVLQAKIDQAYCDRLGKNKRPF